jgi:hypothetical protein
LLTIPKEKPTNGFLCGNSSGVKAIYYILCFCAQTLVVFLVLAENFLILYWHAIKVSPLDLEIQALFLLFRIFSNFGRNPFKTFYYFELISASLD